MEPEITLKNTKAEILDALNQALRRAEQAEKGRLNPEKLEREKNEKRAVETAKKAVEQNIFSKELMEKFNDLQAAIAAEEARLQELYGVSRELTKLALVLEAGKEKIAEIEAGRMAKEAEARSSLEKLREEFTQKREEQQAENDAYLKKLKQDRTRENEEYQYNLTRTRERDNNAWKDEKAARELALQKREAQASDLLAEAESKADYIRTLEEQQAAVPALIQAEREAAIAATTEELQRTHAHQAALAEMEYKSAVARLEDKVQYLTKELDAANKSIAMLQTKLDKAYSEMRDLAGKTVEAAGGVKIIGGEGKSGV